MQQDIQRVLIDGDRINARVRELAAQITVDHTPPRMPGDAEITIVPILTGAMIFAADLIRAIPLAMRINLVTVSSYPGQSVRSQGSQVLTQQLPDVRGRHVLLVDDILDTGGTLASAVPLLEEMGAGSVRTCVLLKKRLASPPKVEADYVGFEIPDEFVVGYGLDFNNLYRNLPDIVVLRPEVIDGAPS
jgi:hypoxanthine phosphoribosyltransferase